MKLTEKEAALEAILFTMGEAVETKRLAEAIGETPEKKRELLEKLRAGWEKEHRGVNLISLEDSWQMCTRSEFYDYLIRIAKAPKKYTLTDTLLETLSIIAYKQPVTRLDVEKIRGVNCDHAINRLVEYDLVEELGRLDAPGRPLLFGTTEQFLRSFGVGSLEVCRSCPPYRLKNSKSRQSRRRCCSCRRDSHITAVLWHIIGRNPGKGNKYADRKSKLEVCRSTDSARADDVYDCGYTRDCCEHPK